MPQLPLPPDVYAAQGFPHEPNPSTPMQAGTSPLEIWYSGVVNQTAYAVGAISLDFIYANPVVIGRTGIIDRIAFEVTTGAGGGTGGVGRCGIYASGADGYPAALIVDGGEQSTEVAAVKASTVSVFLSAGRYWFVTHFGVAACSARKPAAGGINTILGVPTTMGANCNLRLVPGVSYAALPATFPAGATASTGIYQLVHIRFAS